MVINLLLKDILAPLQACHRSLCAIGAYEVANGRLLDVIRRLKCFGLTLVKLDLRQEASRHTEVADAVYVLMKERKKR